MLYPVTVGVPAPTNPDESAPERKSGLHLDEIVDTAIAIADEDGLESLSMRRVAERLGHGAMSLYRHVKDKDQLIGFAVDAVFAEESFPEPAPRDWMGRLHESAYRQWRCYLRHPWIVSLVTLARPRIGPNGMREMEWAFEGLLDLDIADSERLHLYLVVTAFVHGAAAQAVVEAAEERRTGLVAKEWWSAQSALLGDILSTGRYPLISRLGRTANPSPDAWFEFGLNCLLDGLQAKVQSHSA
jgi:AcrR family transcriptional regulator